MTKSKFTVLIAEDDTNHRNMLAALLKEWGYEVIETKNGKEAVICCQKKQLPDLVLLDCKMPVLTGKEALGKIRHDSPNIPVIMMTAYSEIADAVESIRMGAFDYLAKPLDIEKLKIVLCNALSQIISERENKDCSISGSDDILFGQDETMQNVKMLISAVAPTEATVLITGESGTGKELAAREIHGKSHRKNGPFIAINCGAFTETILASELFGHEKGAFTGADKKHNGLFIEASGGTIFLDEIGEMPLSMQVKLLRVLQEREILSVGGQKAVPINCRILAATNRDLAKEITLGKFREDLYYRLNVVGINMPPLKQRASDIPQLAKYFAQKFANTYNRQFKGIDEPAMYALKTYTWPGNVRELSNVMERAVILMNGEMVRSQHLPERLVEESETFCNTDDDSFISSLVEKTAKLEEIEKKIILKTLERFDNNKSDAAKALGISRKTLHSKINRYKDDAETKEN